MDPITVKPISDKQTWENFALAYKGVSFLQSWYWGEFHKALNHSVYRSGFYQGDKLVGLMLSIVEPAKRGRYLTVPGGPLIDWLNPQIVDKFIEEINRIAKAEKCVFIRVRPPLENSEISKALFKNSGFVSAPIHLHVELTSLLNIEPTEEELLSNMRKATRYEIKKGIKEGVIVSATDNPEAIREFYELQLLTAQRQHFVPFSYDYFYYQFKAFVEDGKALLYRAEFEGKLLAQGMIIFYGNEAAYHYGASTEEGRKHPGAYLIQWEAIKEAKKRGFKVYNFWGVANDKNHRFYSLSIFKRGFGGEDFEYLHAQDLVVNKVGYGINLLVEKIRKYIRRV